MNERIEMMNSIRPAIAKIMCWGERDFEIIPSGLKGGRPNWEIQHYKGNVRFAFTAFDGGDIDGLHMVNR